MPGYHRSVSFKEIRHLLLCKPYGFVLQPDFKFYSRVRLVEYYFIVLILRWRCKGYWGLLVHDVNLTNYSLNSMEKIYCKGDCLGGWKGMCVFIYGKV